MTVRIPARYHRIDGWRGYSIPGTAVAGSSYTGEWSDSPAPRKPVQAEIERFRKEVLRPAGIRSKVRTGHSSNVFMVKLWVTVRPQDWHRAFALANEWLEKHDRELHYLHSAKD